MTAFAVPETGIETRSRSPSLSPCGLVQHHRAVGSHGDEVAPEAQAPAVRRRRAGSSRPGLVGAQDLEHSGLVARPRRATAPRHGRVQLRGRALQLGPEPDRGAPHDLRDGAAGVHGVERAVGAHGGLADLLEDRYGPGGSPGRARPRCACLSSSEDEPLLGVGADGALERRELVRELPRGRLEGRARGTAAPAPAPGDRSTDDGCGSAADRGQVVAAARSGLAAARRPGPPTVPRRRWCVGGVTGEI